MDEVQAKSADTMPAVLQGWRRDYGDLLQIEGADGAGWTFEAIDMESARVARGLLAEGVGKGGRVGLMLPNGPAWLVAFCAITRIGAMAVLMSTFFKPPEIAHAVRHGDLDTLITTDRFLSADFVARLEAALPGLADRAGDRPLRPLAAPFLRSIWVWGETQPAWSRGDRAALAAAAEREGIDARLLEEVETEVTPADPALTIYTSGSTAAPKAVVHSQGTLVRHSRAMSRDFMACRLGDRLMGTMPFFWIGGLDLSLLAVNHSGATHVVPDEPTPAGMLRALRNRNVTHIQLWTHDVQALMNHPDARPDDFARLRPSSAQQLALFKAATPQQTPNSLGMSETFGPHSGERPDAVLPDGYAGSFGRRIEAMERIIVDPATGERLPPGQVGELWVRGPFLMQGMYKIEREDLFQPGGYYRTGDVCSLSEDGYLFFTGRNTEMIKCKGANVAPREVELVLAGAPGVAEASVMGLADPDAGEAVVAVVVPREGAHLTEAALIAHARERLSSYKVPSRIVFFQFDDIPRTASAKVQKGPLRELLLKRLGRAV